MDSLLVESVGKGGKQKRQRKKTTETNDGWTSWQLAKALDHALKLYGLKGLSFFVENTEYSSVLKPAEIRQWVDMNLAECGHHVPSGVAWQQPLIVDTTNGERRWEMKSWVAAPTLLVLTGDEASSNLRMLHWLSGQVKARVLWFRDPAHRSWNDARAGLRDTGLWVDILESLQVCSTLQGPWRTGSWWTEMKASASQHIAKGSWQDPWFVALLDELSAEYKHIVQDTSDDSLKAVWNALVNDRALDAKGQKVGMTRWFQWCESWKKFGDRYYTMYFHMLVLAKSTGIYKSVDESPLGGVSFTRELSAPVAAAGRHGKDGVERVALQEIEIQRSKTKNAVELACQLMSQDCLRRRTSLALAVLQPLWTAHGKEVKNMHDVQRNFTMQRSFAKNQYNFVILKMWGLIWRVEKMVDEMHFVLSVIRPETYADEMKSTGLEAGGSSGENQSLLYRPRR
eukprot:4561027-Amphidinium_carterae.2